MAARDFHSQAAGEQDRGVGPDENWEMEWNPLPAAGTFADNVGAGKGHEKHQDGNYAEGYAGVIAAR